MRKPRQGPCSLPRSPARPSQLRAPSLTSAALARCGWLKRPAAILATGSPAREPGAAPSRLPSYPPEGERVRPRLRRRVLARAAGTARRWHGPAAAVRGWRGVRLGRLLWPSTGWDGGTGPRAVKRVGPFLPQSCKPVSFLARGIQLLLSSHPLEIK